MVASTLMAIAQLAAFELDRLILGRPFVVLRLPYLLVALACLIVLWRRRDKLSFKTIQIIIIALTLAVPLHLDFPGGLCQF